MSYLDDSLAEVVGRNPNEPEFHLAVRELAGSVVTAAGRR